MSTANRKNIDAVYQGLEDVCMSERDRECARYVLRDAEMIADAVIWTRERMASLRGLFVKPSSTTRNGAPT
jgi:hypothetical protein